MVEYLRKVFNEKFDKILERKQYCTIKWLDTDKFEVIAQEYIRLPSEQEPKINVTYTIIIDGVKRSGRVFAAGTKQYCKFKLYQHSLQTFNSEDSETSVHDDEEPVDDLLLMQILGKLLNKSKTNENENNHDVQCATCHMKPISQVDRYCCLECSTSSLSYNLCGYCFEKRLENEHHHNGHAMIHFKLPDEFLGIHINDLNNEITLNKIKQLNILQYEQHHDIHCDGICQKKNFIGLCFKCDICPNYNLCEICALEKHVCTKMHRRDHPLILISEKMMPAIHPDDIELGEKIGGGAFGCVYVANWRSKNRQVACKVIELSNRSSDFEILHKSFLRELAAYHELSGSYIIRTYAYSTRELPSNRIRGSITQFMIIMELMGNGSLQNILNQNPNQITLRRKLSMARQIASGMRRIHQHGMIHRDIRPDNILITDDYNAKIGDMGIARILNREVEQTQIGCSQFMPPEFYQESNGHIKYDEKLDIFTYGLTLNQLFTGVLHDGRFGVSGSRIIITKQSPVFYEEIISKCIDYNPKRRPNAIEIEKILELYEHIFIETTFSNKYTKMNTEEKDRVFLEFYYKNKPNIQRFLQEQFIQETPVEFLY